MTLMSITSPSEIRARPTIISVKKIVQYEVKGCRLLAIVVPFLCDDAETESLGDKVGEKMS
jgi:hypothetical protein